MKPVVAKCRNACVPCLQLTQKAGGDVRPSYLPPPAIAALAPSPSHPSCPAECRTSAGVGYTGYRSCRPLGTHLACKPGGAGADRVSGVKNDSNGSKQNPNNTKTVVVVTVRRVVVVVVAIRRATIGRVVVPITAADHAVGAGAIRSIPLSQAPSRRPNSSIASAAY